MRQSSGRPHVRQWRLQCPRSLRRAAAAAAALALAAFGSSLELGPANAAAPGGANPARPVEATLFRKIETKSVRGLPDKLLPKWYGRHPCPTKAEELPLEIPGGVQKPTRRETMLRSKLKKGIKPEAEEFEKTIRVFANRARQELSWLAVQRREFLRRAKRWAGEMLLQKLKPSLTTLQVLLLGCAAVGDTSGAEWYLDWMKKNGHEFGRLEYNAVIGAHGQEGQPNKARQWLYQMTRAGLKPDARTYSSLVEAWERVGNRKEMLMVLREMQDAEALGELGEPQDPRDAALPYCGMARSYVKVADAPRALSILKFLQKQDLPVTHEAHRLRLEVNLRTPQGPRRSLTEIERAFRDLVSNRPKTGPLYSDHIARMTRFALGNSRYEEILTELGTEEHELIPDLPGTDASRRWRRANIQAAMKSRRATGNQALYRPNEDRKWFLKRLADRKGAQLGKIKTGIRIEAEEGLPEWMTLPKPEKFGY